MILGLVWIVLGSIFGIRGPEKTLIFNGRAHKTNVSRFLFECIVFDPFRAEKQHKLEAFRSQMVAKTRTTIRAGIQADKM